MAHARAPHEAVSPVVTVSHAILLLQQDRPVDLILVQRPGDGVPVAHHQSKNFVRFVEAGELAGVRHLAAEDLPIVFARYHGLGPAIKAAKNPSSSSTFIALPPLQLLRIWQPTRALAKRL